MKKIFFSFVLVCLTIFNSTLIGKEKNAMEEPKSYLIKVKKVSSVKDGKIAYLQGTATKKGDNLKLTGLSVDQEVRVVLLSDKPNKKVAMELRKFHWATPNRKGTTDNKGYYIERFHTEGEFYIRIYPLEEDTPIHLFIWVGEHNPPSMKPVLISKGSQKKTISQDKRSGQ